MEKLLEAKAALAANYKDVQGFLGVGIGRTNGLDVIRVYVESVNCAAARRIAKLESFDGIPLNIKIAGKITAGV